MIGNFGKFAGNACGRMTLVNDVILDSHNINFEHICNINMVLPSSCWGEIDSRKNAV